MRTTLASSCGRVRADNRQRKSARLRTSSVCPKGPPTRKQVVPWPRASARSRKFARSHKKAGSTLATGVRAIEKVRKIQGAHVLAPLVQDNYQIPCLNGLEQPFALDAGALPFRRCGCVPHLGYLQLAKASKALFVHVRGLLPAGQLQPAHTDKTQGFCNHDHLPK